MANRQLDPNFYIPEELVGFDYVDDETEIIDEASGDEFVDDGSGLQPPSNIKIISQTVRKVKGKQVVDVIIEINDDNKKGLTYDRQITKETVAPTDDNVYVFDQNEEV